MVVLKKLLFLTVLCYTSILSAQYIQVDDTYSAQQLVQDILIDSPCAGVSNFSVSGDTFTQGAQSFGYFTNTSPNFPFSNGIVLSTARAIRSEGPNSDLIDEGSTSWTGDADLEQALGIQGTFNATILEFDFTPLTSQISFDYIFASEEYHGTATCIYSDGFAFLLRPANSTQPYQNLALIPNTSTPVSVTNVHPEIPNGCQAENEIYFGGFNNVEHPINYNGQTAVMTAKANVIPGTTYHIKLVIADEQNIRYDSAIFLGGGSFSVGTDIGPDRLFSTNNPICFGDTFTLDATESGSNTYQWFKNGNLIAGETNATYTVSDAGTYSVEINLGSSGCIATGEAVIEYANPPLLNDPTVLIQCDPDNDGTTTFDLDTITNIVTLGNSQLSAVAYYETFSNAQNQLNPIQNSSAYQSISGKQLTARAVNSYGCPGYATVTLTISNNAMATQNPVVSCDQLGAQDGITSFDLSQQATPQIVSGLPSGLIVEYYGSPSDAVMQNNQLPNNFTNSTSNQQIIYGRIVNGPDCVGIIPVTLVINTIQDFAAEDAFLCEGNPITLSVANTFASYLWNTGDTGNTLTVSGPDTYSVTVTDTNGCTATKTFNVSGSGIGTITSISIDDFAGENNSISVSYSGLGVYEFSVDGSNFQDSPIFNDLSEGEYFVYIRDKNGCGTPPPTFIYVLDYPKFFTPNNDGFHDLWYIKNLQSRHDAVVTIFDRYGKLIYSFDNDGIGWDGKMNASELPSTDYWFTISFGGKTTVKSHFALKR